MPHPGPQFSSLFSKDPWPPNASPCTSHIRATYAWGLVSTRWPIPSPDPSKYLGPKPGIHTVNQSPKDSDRGTEHNAWAKGPPFPDQQPHLHDSLERVLENLSHFLSRPTGPSYRAECPGPTQRSAEGRGDETQTQPSSQITSGAGTQPCSSLNTWHPEKGLAYQGHGLHAKRMNDPMSQLGS